MRLQRAWLGRIEILIRERTGLVFREDRRAELEEVILDEMREKRLTSELEYRKLLDEDSCAFTRLIERITVGETYFLREREQLDFIQRSVLPQLASRRAGRGIRIWSAGCASGEEAYTLAILLHEAVLASGSTVIGTDISEERLARARVGRYRAWSLRTVPDRIRGQYFERRGSHWEIAPEIRQHVEFRRMNLTEERGGTCDPDLLGVDLILCRNVLIYFDPDSIAAAARQLIGALGEDGWLFLGASDPRIDEYVECRVVVTDGGLAYRRSSAPRSRPEQSRLTGAGSASRRTPSPADLGGAAASGPVAARRRVTTTIEAKEPSVGDRNSKVGPWRGEASGTDEDLEEAIARARELADRGDVAAADKLVLATLDRFPTSAELMYLHGLLLSEARRPDEAIVAVRRAIYLDREYAAAHLILGSLLLKRGDPQGARRALEYASKLLSKLPPHEVVEGSGGTLAVRLLEAARMQLRIIGLGRE